MFKSIYSLSILFSLLLCTLPNKMHSKTPPKKQKKIYILGAYATQNLPFLVKGQINNQIFAIFSGIDTFSSESLSDIQLNKAETPLLLKKLTSIYSNPSAVVPPFNLNGKNISRATQRKLSKSYLLVIPTVIGYKLNTTTTNTRTVQRKTIVITNHTVTLSIRFQIIRPYLNTISHLTTIESHGTHNNKLAAHSACVTLMGKKLGAVIENTSFFNTETEISFSRGLNTFFFNKNIFFTPYPGVEYSVFKLTRYEDGYIDEKYKGIIRISGKSGALWEARSIYGELPQPGDRIIPKKRARIAIVPYGKVYFINIKKDRFSGFTNSSWSGKDIRLLYGGGLQFSGEFGYSFRMFIDGSYYSDPQGKFCLWQGMLGLGWDFYLARKFSINFSLAGSLRYIRNWLGTVNDGSSLDEESVLATAFNPGVEINLSFDFMLVPSLLFRINAGYSFYIPIKKDDWVFYVDDDKHMEYAPTTTSDVYTGGPFISGAFSFRL